VIASSLITLVYQIIRYSQKNKEYEPLSKSSRSNTNNYGSINVQEDESDTSSSDTVISPEPKARSWTLFDWIRCILSIIQLYLVIKITLFTKNSDIIDKPIEGAYHDLLNMYYTRIILWVRI
jgi:hypothetical protein